MSETPRDFEHQTPAPHAKNHLTSPPPTVPPRREGTPLSTGLLAVGVCAVLMVLAKPLARPPLDGASPAMPGTGLAIGGAIGGIFAVILAFYCTRSWRTVVASYFAGAATAAVAIRLLVAPQDVRLALVGAALLLVFGTVVRGARRKPIIKGAEG
jgi:hypothetical protein